MDEYRTNHTACLIFIAIAQMLNVTRREREGEKIVEREKENKIFHGNQAVNGVDFFQFNLS